MTEADFLHIDAEHAEYIGTLEGYYGSEDRPFSVRPFNADVVNTVKEQHIQERLFSAETRVKQLEEWLADLEDNGMPAQCSTRVLLKAKDELGLLDEENKDSETTEGENQ